MPFDYTITRSSKRKTLSIIIKEAVVRVLAPTWLSEKKIIAMLNAKQQWITNKLKEQNALLATRPPLPVIAEDTTLTLFGKPFSISIKSGTKTQFVFNRGRLALIISTRVKPENVQAHLSKQVQLFYREQLQAQLQNRLPILADNMGLVYQKVSVKNFKAKWGSCNNRGELDFNWRLAAMPFETIDSVCIHELAHLKHLDHSRDFWALVAKYDPEYQFHKQVLRQYSTQIWF
ncbi:M48 family metallopeptidase [Algibacillus agarilyticus]|uniref:M48 family metallopeptidase n=1 Tax=Algibacillus agarilyticus TaxID=2234133 RepID=UPI0022B83F06|nr:SprT family zinc-dependent metalloprotease [Algibacillus agarilyticus]